MRFLKPLMLVSAALCAISTLPSSSVAQDAPSWPAPTTKPSSQDDDLTQPLYDCACGCGIFEVGTSSMLPSGMTGLVLYLEYAYQDQNKNWSGINRAPAANNPDKEIRTIFLIPGFQYYFNRDWGIQAEVQLANRYFKTTGGPTGDDIVSLDWNAVGDTRIQGIYTGFSPDQSLGITFGAKLPTGNWRHSDGYPDIDRDSEIGTGSTDALFGGFYRNFLTPDGSVGWFAQFEADIPVLFQQGYRPGAEADAALGIDLNGIRFGRMAVTPIAQILNGIRGTDTGPEAANPIASGYERILLSPGIEFDLHPLMVYADVEFPIYDHVLGNQLIAPELFKIIFSYHF
jgi:hypothetical protein